MISTLATVHVTGSDHGKEFSAHQPRVIVTHSVEAPIKRGQAKFRMELLAARKNASGHYLVDPGVIASGVEEQYIAWGAGTVNNAAIHVEFMGYAHYTRAQWTTPDGLAMLRLGGDLIADIAGRRGIPLRWLTDAQLLAAWKGQGPGGLTTHDQCRRVIGGTTHHDPGDGFPKDLLLQYATQGDDDMPTAREVADELLNTKIRVTDAAQGPHGSTSEETVRDILARVLRVTALTQDAVRKDALEVDLNPEAIKQIANAVKEALK